LGEEKFGALLDLVSGWNVDRINYGDLIRLGHVFERDESGCLRIYPFGEMYTEYLGLYAKRMERPSWLKDNELWGLIRLAEVELRQLIQSSLEEKFKDNWESQLEAITNRITIKINGKLSTIYESWSQKRDAERRTFRVYEDVPMLPLLHYSYIGELGQIISIEWANFKGLFRDKGVLNDKISDISRVRNPEAHFREGVIPQNEIDRAKVACNDVLLAIRNFRKPKYSDTD